MFRRSVGTEERTGGGQADRIVCRSIVLLQWGVSHRNHFDCGPSMTDCYGIGEMLAPNHKGRRTTGGSHGDDTDSDGAYLTGPHPYSEGENESFAGMLPVPLECGLEPRTPRSAEIR